MSLEVSISLRAEQDMTAHMEGNSLRIERVMHGARDLPKRLLEDPE